MSSKKKIVLSDQPTLKDKGKLTGQLTFMFSENVLEHTFAVSPAEKVTDILQDCFQKYVASQRIFDNVDPSKYTLSVVPKMPSNNVTVKQLTTLNGNQSPIAIVKHPDVSLSSQIASLSRENLTEMVKSINLDKKRSLPEYGEKQDISQWLQEAKEVLGGWKQELDEKNKELDEKNKELDEKNKEIKSWKQQLDEKNKELDEKNKELDEKNKEIKSWKQELDKKNKELSDEIKSWKESSDKMIQALNEAERNLAPIHLYAMLECKFGNICLI
jgi:myosin heavy subunit